VTRRVVGVFVRFRAPFPAIKGGILKAGKLAMNWKIKNTASSIPKAFSGSSDKRPKPKPMASTKVRNKFLHSNLFISNYIFHFKSTLFSV
jgi:hypothetical protein